ncbi:MAG: LytTR family DNA-binding domain-containing protein [Lachnospiraceae bacterium]|nr:LytTR family DNA-binding domain-containing protein [Lachnospiraceae bacterium]
MLNLAICEDNGMEARKLAEELSKLDDWKLKWDIYSSGEELLEASNYLKQLYDLFILDIEMPGMNGIELAKTIRKQDEKAIFIFTTYHKQYRIPALDLITMGYILKPITHEKIEETLVRARPFIKERDRRIRFTSNAVEYNMRIKDILYVMKEGRKKIIVSDSGEYSSYMKTEEILSFMDDSFFSQPHSSYIVNLSRITSIGNNKIVLENGEVVPISKGQKKTFEADYLEFIERYL